jgi:hypothetical protein
VLPDFSRIKHVCRLLEEGGRIGEGGKEQGERKEKKVERTGVGE